MAEVVLGSAEAITEVLRVFHPIMANSIAGSVSMSMAVAWKRWALARGDATACSSDIKRLGEMLIAVAEAATEEDVIAVAQLHADAE